MQWGAGDGIDEADRFEIDGVEFVPSWARPSQPGSLSLRKHVGMVAAYERLLAPYPAPRMVELGIAQGGSVGLLALLARPTRFVALELDPNPIGPLLDMLRDQGLADSVTAHFGVDQADAARLRAILDDAFGGEALDLVVDDASHQYAETVASFEVLFPRLRPGGTYVIEDWNSQDLMARQMASALSDPADEGRHERRARLEAHLVRVLDDPADPAHDALASVIEVQLRAAAADPDAPQNADVVALLAARAADGEPIEPEAPRPPHGASRPHVPLSRLGLELTLARAGATDAIEDVCFDPNWIRVRRGPGSLDPDRFRVGDLYDDAYGLLA